MINETRLVKIDGSAAAMCRGAPFFCGKFCTMLFCVTGSAHPGRREFS